MGVQLAVQIPKEGSDLAIMFIHRVKCLRNNHSVGELGLWGVE